MSRKSNSKCAYLDSLLCSVGNKPFHFYLNIKHSLACCIIYQFFLFFLLCCSFAICLPFLQEEIRMRIRIAALLICSLLIRKTDDPSFPKQPLPLLRCPDKGELLITQTRFSLLALEFSFQSISGCSSLVDLLVQVIPLPMLGGASLITLYFQNISYQNQIEDSVQNRTCSRVSERRIL